MQLLGYPVKSMGQLVSTHYVEVQATDKVAEVLNQMRRHRHGADPLDMLYVTDASGKLMDDFQLGEFLLVDQKQPVSALMANRFIAMKVN